MAAVFLVALTQAAIIQLQLPVPTFFGTELVSRKYGEILRLDAATPVDVVVVGHSHALMSVDARKLERQTGLTTYNFAIPTTDLRMQSMLVRDFIVPRIRPQVILWHVDPQVHSGFQINRSIVDSRGFRMQQGRLGHAGAVLLRHALPQHKRPIEDWIALLVDFRDDRYDDRGFLSESRKYSNEKARSRGLSGAPNVSGGKWQFPVSNVVKGNSRNGLSLPTIEHADKRPLWGAFRQALQLASERSVTILAFSAPRSRDTYAPEKWFGGVLRKGAFDNDIAQLEGILAEFKIPYANYRYYPAISDVDWLLADTDHLNRAGAQHFTEVLAADFFSGPPEFPAILRGVISPAERQVLSLPYRDRPTRAWPVNELAR